LSFPSTSGKARTSLRLVTNRSRASTSAGMAWSVLAGVEDAGTAASSTQVSAVR
jgi:hypothetical protein